METKEQILKRNVEVIAKCSVKYNVTNKGILKAMDEYTNQVSAQKDKHILDLESKLDKIKIFIESDLTYPQMIGAIAEIFDDRDYAQEYEDMKNDTKRIFNNDIDDSKLPF